MQTVLALLSVYVFVLGLGRFYRQCCRVWSWVRDRVML